MIKKALLKERKKIRGNCQPVVKKGSVVVRDLRLWHGGMPNLEKDPRVMLAMSESCRSVLWYASIVKAPC